MPKPSTFYGTTTHSRLFRVLLVPVLVLSLALFLPLWRVQAAPTITEAVAEIVSTANAATYDFGSFTPATNALLVVMAMVRATETMGTITTVSGTSLSWTTEASSGNLPATTDMTFIAWARTPGTTAASVYRVNVTGDNGTGCIAYMFELTGADQSTQNPVRQNVINGAVSTNATTGTLSQSMDTDSGYVAAWWGALSSSNPANVSTEPTSWTEIGDNGFATPTTNGSGAFRSGGETGTSVTFTNNSTTWSLAFAEIYNTGEGPSGAVRDPVGSGVIPWKRP